MLFELKITASKTNFAKKNNSLLIKFFTDEKKLKIDYAEFLKKYSSSEKYFLKVAKSGI